MQHQYQHNSVNSLKAVAPQEDSDYEQIIREMESLDKKNKKLLSIADNIMKTSFLRQTDQTPAVIVQLEQDMKASFNALIQSIREFFISIDSKLKQLGVAIERKVGQPSDLCRSKFSGRTESDNMQTLTLRMGILENNMKKAQQNESKLLSIIEEMNARRLSSDQQPTLVKEPGRGVNLAVCKPLNLSGSHQQNSFRLFSLNQSSQRRTMQQPQPQPQPETHQTYKRFQQYSNYPIVESLGPYQQKIKQTPFLCSPLKKQKQTERGLPKHGNMLKSNPQQLIQMQHSNRIHRLSNLMKALKE